MRPEFEAQIPKLREISKEIQDLKTKLKNLTEKWEETKKALNQPPETKNEE